MPYYSPIDATLIKLKDKLVELEATYPRCDASIYRDIDTGFKEYETDYAKHMHSVKCVRKAINKLEEAGMVRHAMDLIGD
jgi:hypothetical protein